MLHLLDATEGRLSMHGYAYGERDYAFGQLILTLRTTLGLTQTGLADQLGVSRHAVAQWEGGSSYPKAEHLKHLIELGWRARAFPAGHEAEAIRQIWRAAHQKVLLDESWLLELSASSPTEPAHRDTRPAEAMSSNKVALWTVPFARNPHFTGRDALLNQLTGQLTSEATEQATLPVRRVALTQAQVIKGLGGIGKTQVAVEYAYRARELGRYTHTLWITAATEETLLMSFAALADRLPGLITDAETNSRKLVAAILHWLEQCPEPWLLIVDNADDLSLIQPYLPLQGNGNILLTTRASAAGWLGPSLEVDTMGLLEGAELLLRRAQRRALASDTEINAAVNLVGALGQFPLALDQAGAYIEETGCSLSDYLQLYQTHRHALLSRRGMQATRYPASVATTWELSFQHIEQTNEAAAELLNLCAFLSPDHIPEELLTEGAKEWPLALQQAIADRFRFNQAISALLAFSLVKRLSEDRLLSIHRLVQVVQRERLPTEEQRQWAERVVRAMNRAFPQESQETASWPQCSRYLDQVQTCDTLIEEYHLRFPEAASLLTRTGAYQRERGMYTLAESLSLHALAICSEQAGACSEQMAATLTQLGFLYQVTGRTSQVEVLYQRALAIHEHLLGPDHAQTIASLYSLASLYEAQRRPQEAEELALRVLEMRERRLGPEHLDTITTLDFLAMLYLTLGRYEEAELLFQRVLAIRERLLGPNHLETARSLNGLGILFLKKGKYAQVEPLYQRVLQIFEQHLGETHPRTMTMWQNLANLSRLQGRYEEAEQRLVRVLARRLELFGPLHPYTADSLALLAEIYQRQERLAEAEQTILRALDIREHHADPDETNLATSFHVLGLVYRDQGRLSEAETAFQRALTIREQMLSPTHTDLAQTLHDLALVRQLQGMLPEARMLYERALLARTQTMGQDHPETRDTHEQLDAVLIALGPPSGYGTCANATRGVGGDGLPEEPGQ
jgi:tetratricopeptide (TPR) repeat protein/transcriptional regulator with XRE-family HTH domain